MSALEDEVTERLKRLSPEKREQVLEYTRTLGKKPEQGAPSEVLRPFLGIWSPEEADAIERAIEEACERVDDE